MNKNIFLIDEVQSSIDLIKEGICKLKKIDADIYTNPIPLLLLSSGFERLCKCIICLQYYHTKGKYPSINFIRDNFNHDLKKLLSHIRKELKNIDYDTKNVALKRDMDFIDSNDNLKKFNELLSDYGEGARYYNLDMITSVNSKYKKPEEVISELEDIILGQNPSIKALQNDVKHTNDFIQKLNNELIIILEKYARALCRPFTFAELGNLAGSMSGTINDFLFLMDSDLGNTKYCI